MWPGVQYSDRLLAERRQQAVELSANVDLAKPVPKWLDPFLQFACYPTDQMDGQKLRLATDWEDRLRGCYSDPLTRLGVSAMGEQASVTEWLRQCSGMNGSTNFAQLGGPAIEEQTRQRLLAMLSKYGVLGMQNR